MQEPEQLSDDSIEPIIAFDQSHSSPASTMSTTASTTVPDRPIMPSPPAANDMFLKQEVPSSLVRIAPAPVPTSSHEPESPPHSGESTSGSVNGSVNGSINGSINGSVTASKGRSNSTIAKDAASQKVTKRRAARACASCRARKVRCDVVEARPCGNCRWDNIPCVVQESRRRKKNLSTTTAATAASALDCDHGHDHGHDHGAVSDTGPTPSINGTVPSTTGGSLAASLRGLLGQQPLPQISGIQPQLAPQLAPQAGIPPQGRRSLPNLVTSGGNPITPIERSAGLGRLSDALNESSIGTSVNDVLFAQALMSDGPTAPDWQSSILGQPGLLGSGITGFPPTPPNALPGFIRPLPAKIGPDDIVYLRAKGALTMPSLKMQSALIHAYAEFVHPFMPLLDMHTFVTAVHARNDPRGQMSLFLYHCVMFAASSFIDIQYLRECGYLSRRAARKAFYVKARALYDADYESDRLILVQGLLLMTFWYESPDDQKDTWHWMGIANSMAHSIGLHRISSLMNVPPRKLGLYRRIWWSCFMRDQEIALGMRRPTRIKAGDFNVDMLKEEDFDIRAVPSENTTVPRECRMLRDVAMQKELAQMTIAKAELCILVSNMLKIQYSVHTKGTVPMDSGSMLFPNKTIDNADDVKDVDTRLNRWRAELSEACINRPLTPFDVEDGKATIAVHRSLLHMIYYTTQSALHRPQFLGLQPAPAHLEIKMQQAQELARVRVRDAATQITRMATDLHELELDRYLPTTGVTIVLPAMIIHMLEMKHANPAVRDHAVRGFKQCMDVMQTLRTCYAAAEYATGFLDAFLRKASIDLTAQGDPNQQQPQQQQRQQQQQTAPQQTTPQISVAQLQRQLQAQQQAQQAASLFFHTPPPEVPDNLFGVTQPQQAQQQTTNPIFNIPNIPSADDPATSQTPMSVTLSLASVPIMPPESILAASPPAEQPDLWSTEMDIDIGGLRGEGETGVTEADLEWTGVSTGEVDLDYWLQFPGDVQAGADGLASAVP